MISGTNTDYDCVQHVGSLHQYKSAATSAEWAHVVAEHSMNLWHSSIAFREIFLSQGSKKSENRNIFNVGCVNRPVMCANNKIRLHIPDNCRNWMRNYREIHRKERLAIPRKQSQLGQFRYTMPPRPIFPEKSCLPMPKSTQCGWMLFRTLIAQLFFTYLEWDGHQIGYDHLTIHRRLLTAFLKGTT